MHASRLIMVAIASLFALFTSCSAVVNVSATVSATLTMEFGPAMPGPSGSSTCTKFECNPQDLSMAMNPLTDESVCGNSSACCVYGTTNPATMTIVNPLTCTYDSMTGELTGHDSGAGVCPPTLESVTVPCTRRRTFVENLGIKRSSYDPSTWTHRRFGAKVAKDV